ncbi:MAG TPA: hypothetical protein VMY78_04135 [Solirubrobacteraceae bacterium]|nr:hypothetical protein [Solirubrobacteraceae bacterium]
MASPRPTSRPTDASTYQSRPRETATDRRNRQLAAATNVQADLKREAAERRAKREG